MAFAATARRLAACAWLCGALAVSACGFQPLYGNRPQVAPALSRIDVAEIRGRLGYELRESLIDELGLVQGGTPAYRLLVSPSGTLEQLAIQQDESITRYNYHLIADYRLVSTEDGTDVLQGSARTTAAYNVVTSQFATLVARRDVEARAAESVAREIRRRLAMHFATVEG